MAKTKPVVCTLSETQLATRGKRWSDIIARAGAIVERVQSGVTIQFTRNDEILAEIEELVALERSCCEWMTLNLRYHAGVATLLMTADSEEGVEVIYDLLS